MKKEIFDNHNGSLFCESCKKMVPKDHMNHRRVKPNYVVSKCNVDMWLDRHKGFEPPENFSIFEVKEALHYLLYSNGCILNDIATKLSRPLSEIIDLYFYLNVKGKQVKVRTQCTKCGKEILKYASVYLNSDDCYCSHQCYALDKIEKVQGSNNPNYRRVITTCSCCGKEIAVIPFDYEKHNSYGDNHNFCSQQCYWDFRRQYYVQEKTHFYHHEYTEDEKKKMRDSILKSLEKTDRLNTTPQQIVDELLRANNIKNIREKVFDYYAVDNYLPDCNGIIEVMGDYWHTSPLKFGEKRQINTIQQKQIHRDKIKYSYIKNHYNISILYLWESDIIKNVQCCSELIAKYVDSLENDYLLPDYHSFNWSYSTELQLNDTIVVPFQFQHIEQYRKYFLLQNA